MGFFKSLKGKASSQKDEHDNPPAYADAHKTDSKATQSYHPAAPQTNPSLNPFRDQAKMDDVYKAPPGPPPSHQHPAETVSNPPPYESWQDVPDTSDFPPPPALQNEHSSANNASFSAAEQGHRWCASFPVYNPTIPRNTNILEYSQAGQLGLEAPAGRVFRGKIKSLDPTTWEVKSDKLQQDTTLTSAVPIYFAAASNPLLRSSSSAVTFAFSISITRLHRDAGIAIGFASKPYPPFRLPGWHRASVAVHSDDGNRYINDPHGGVDFMSPFKAGDTVRLSMTVIPVLSPVQTYRGRYRDQRPVQGGLPKCQVRCEVVRNGKPEGGWDIHEERDAEKDEGVEGLQGEADLYCAVGVFGEVEAVVRYEGV